HITYCPPGDSSGLHRDTVFSAGRMPVSATFDEHGEASSTNISFDDFGKMHSITRKQHGDRRLDTPSWAVDDTKLRRLLVRFLEITGGTIRRPGRESEADRVARAIQRRRDRAPKLRLTLDNLCREYVALKDAQVNFPRQRQLEVLIQGHDTALRLVESNAAGTVARIVYLYYRVGYDSVGTSELVGGITPVHVRHILWRLRRV